MARTKGSSGETTKPRIRAAAAGLFAADGYDAVTMRKIGAAVGLRAGALYRYFPDKESLAKDLVTDALDSRDRVLQPADPSVGPLDALETYVEAYLRWQMTSDGGAGIIRLCLPGLGDAGAELRGRAGDPERTVAAILAAGQEVGVFRLPDTAATASAIMAVLDTIAGDIRLPENRRGRIGWSFVRRLVRA